MSPAVPDALLTWAKLPGPAKVLAAARRRIEGGSAMTAGTLRVELDAGERPEVGQLLGTSWLTRGRGVGAKTLVDAVASAGGDLVDLLTAVGGPLRDLPTERADARDAAAAERAAAYESLIAVDVPAEAAKNWLARRGLPRAGSGGIAELARKVAAVWIHLPTGGETTLLSVLANQALDTPHDLDRGSRVATAVLQLAAGDDGAVLGSAESWRTAWENLGVVCDPVSSRVLVLNLHLVGDAAAARLSGAVRGEPVWLTWRSLSGAFESIDAEAYVCENPAVVIEAADQLGERSRPLICTNGRPSGATRRLLTRLAASGTRLHLRADDDPTGQEIVSSLRATLPNSDYWRYHPRGQAEARSAPRYEEQDIDALVADLAAR
ncbi:TIGR02679 domain-containing protein [Actinopolymorpha sp. B11F2]|uniref:TIGR02679 domain-containing protein n=1 Tax=Actinopolymorpha sp. B11F2 TaxID=3160862 RepID=UPI0032E42D97